GEGVCDCGTARVCGCNWICGRGKPTRPAHWRAWVNAGHAFFKRDSESARLGKRGYVSGSHFVLVRDFGQWIVDLLLGWLRAVARCSVRVRERNPANGPMGDVHVDRSHRPNLVRLRLGNPAARDGIPIDLSLPAAPWPALSQLEAADPGDLAFSLARLSHHVRRRPDQIARRPLLARSHMSLLPLRNAAHSEPDQPLSAFCPALVSQI